MGKKIKAICLLFCMICSLSACAQKPGPNMDFKDMESDVSIASSQTPAQDMPPAVIASESKLTIVPSKTRVSEFTKCAGYTEEESDFYNITPDYIADNSEFEIFKDVSSTDSFIMYDGEVYSIGTCFGGFGLTSMALADLNQDGAYELYYTFSFGSGVHALSIGYFDPVKKEVTILDCPLQSHGHELMLTANESGDLCVNIAVIDEKMYQSFVDFSLEAQELIGTVVSSEDTITLHISMDEFIDLLGQDGASELTETVDTDYVFYLEDEGVRDNPVFAAFIDKEITACDAETEESRYIYECYEQDVFGVNYGVHYMAEDLDGDGEKELLILVQWDDIDGDLLVFHEEDGKLYQWETWEYFLWMRMSEIEYHGNGIFSMGGGAGTIVGRYNAEGKIEYIVKCFRDFGYTEEDVRWESENLILYKDGQEEKELSWEGIYSHDDTLEMTPENQANYDEINTIMNEIWEEIGEGRRIKNVGYEENAKKIPLDELLNKQ
ncbi:MAG: hypothetical protein K2I22_02515 [Lachnospiraceae bacterium]|nr:hypothetical protein [Lachnospiraceae bacterium]